jgi:hypothetical protein
MSRSGPVPGSYWVIPERLLAGPYPLAWGEDATPALRGAGIDCFVDLTRSGEYGIAPYSGLVGECEHTRHPIADGGCPAAEEMHAILDTIDLALDRSRGVYVHCLGGIGRTGTVVGCHLVRHGMQPGEALETIAAWRAGIAGGERRSPETDAQERFVLAWSG